MINHARTLLLNIERSRSATETGEEIVPSDYRAVTLPSYLKSLHNILFGAKPDRLMRNYRGRQLLTLLHLTELVQYVQQLDPRITYELGQDDLFSGLFRTTVKPFGGTEGEVFVLGTPEAPDVTGITTRQWRLEVTGGAEVQITDYTNGSVIHTLDYTTSSSLSSEVVLPGSPLRVRFRPNVGYTCRIESVARPTASLGDLTASLQSYGASSIFRLFGLGTVTGAEEPYKTFRNLWEQHHEIAYKLGGLLLAYIYRVEDLRVHHD